MFYSKRSLYSQVLYQDCITKVMNTNRWNLQEVVNINHANLNINRSFVIGCLWQSLCFILCCIVNWFTEMPFNWGFYRLFVRFYSERTYCIASKWIQTFNRSSITRTIISSCCCKSLSKWKNTSSLFFLWFYVWVVLYLPKPLKPL